MKGIYAQVTGGVNVPWVYMHCCIYTDLPILVCTTSENNHIPPSISNGWHKLVKTSSPVIGSFIMGGVYLRVDLGMSYENLSSQTCQCGHHRDLFI